MKAIVGYVNARKHHKIHKGNLHDRTESRIPRGSVSVILDLVAHTDNGGDAVNEKHAGTDLVRLIPEPHGVKQRVVDSDEYKAGRCQ